MGSYTLDNLLVKVGTDEGKSLQKAGAFASTGPVQSLEIDLDLTLLTEAEVVQNDVAYLPDNAMIESIEVITIVAAATGTAIDVGLCHISRNTSDSEFTADPDGILAAFVTASMNAVGESYFAYGTSGSSLPTGTTTRGALVGTILTAPCVITASRTDATAFTAGKIRLRVNFVPQAASALAG